MVPRKRHENPNYWMFAMRLAMAGSPQSLFRAWGWKHLLILALPLCWLLATNHSAAPGWMYQTVLPQSGGGGNGSPHRHHQQTPHPHSKKPAGSSKDHYFWQGWGHDTDSNKQKEPRPGDGKWRGGPEREPFKYTIKPLAYVFPQFHPIPENDEFWGVNFTEWTNVRKVDRNRWGTEVQQPAPEVGYYDLLSRETRARQARLLREIGVHGVVYHHYWFCGGHGQQQQQSGRGGGGGGGGDGCGPVMHRVLQAQLLDDDESDGEPPLPFMLSWANEPWTARWDGKDSSQVLLRQSYGGPPDWRDHFDWLLPYFRHPRYLRSAGRVQFAVYNMPHMSAALRSMCDAFRRWAVEAGLGGMDIIDTRIAGDHDPDPNGHQPDAVAEFAPRAHGSRDPTTWVRLQRTSRTYHRGLHVNWDNTPRHPTDGESTANPFAHPLAWGRSVLRLLERVRMDPNPWGEENFCFVNALNEWGEGNVLEPSVQWGDAFGRAFREAVDLAERAPWRHELIDAGLELAREMQAQKWEGAASEVDVCVLVAVDKAVTPYAEPQHLPQMLRSLQRQSNPRWRAVVYQAVVNGDVATPRATRGHVLDLHDPRMHIITVPEEAWDDDGGGHRTTVWRATDWVVENLPSLNVSCEGASYFVLASPTSVFDPSVFDRVGEGRSGDVIGLSVESLKTIDAAEESDVAWDERCTRIIEGNVTFCQPSTPESPFLDIGAVLLSLPKFRAEGHKFLNFSSIEGADIYHQFDLPALVSVHGWTWGPSPPVDPQIETCDVVQRETYSTCVHDGRFWLDVPTGSIERGGGKRATLRSGCYGLDRMSGELDLDTSLFDMPFFNKTGLCARLNEKAYEEVVQGSR